MKYSVYLAIALSAFVLRAHADNTPKPAIPKLVLISKDKAAATCDSDCDDDKTALSKKNKKPVVMSPKAAAEAGKGWPTIAAN